ncbi:MAG: hypothetical protein AB2794_19145 [Candidatus Thiodiazotropha endolucinida]
MADLGDVEGFDRSGEEDQLYAFQLSDGVYKRKKFTPSEGIRSLKFEELSDVDISHAVPRRLHSLAFTGDKWVAFADPVQQTGWLIDLKIASPYVVTGKEHKLRKVVNSGTRLCSFIPETRNIIVSKAPGPSYVLKTGNGKRGSLKMVSEFPPAGIVGLGLSVSTILLEIVLGDGPDDFVDVLPGFKLKWPQKYANQGVGISIIVQETPRVLFTLKDIEGEADFHLLNLDKLFIGPVSLKRLRFTPGELSFDQTAVIIGQ